MKIKLLLSLSLLIVGYNTSTMAITVNLDSLVHLVQTTTDVNIKINTYRNLADIYMEKPEERHYLKLMYELAHKVDNKEMVLDALSDLAYAHIIAKNIDSVHYYMNLIEKEADSQAVNSYLSHIRIKLFSAQTNKTKQEREIAFEYESDCLKNADKKNIYVQIEEEYIIGSSLYSDRKHKEAAPHLERAYMLASKLMGENAFRYLITTSWLYANNFDTVGSAEKSIELIEDILNLHKTYYEKRCAKQRPYYPINRYVLQCYASLLMRIDTLPKEKAYRYFNEIMKIESHLTEIFDRYNCYLGISHYYLLVKDYPHALQYNDSLIKIAQDLAPNIVPRLYNIKSEYYEDMGDYKNALKTHKCYIQMKDSVASQGIQDQLNTLQVEYQVDKLKLEKTELENRNKKNLLVALSVVLLLTIMACVFFCYHWKKEKQMKIKLYKLNQKAGESEKLKTEFLNSMCHEIRTPLNAIVGFSDIIVDDSFDNETKKEFCDLISSNTTLLTSLIDHLLVVANLDSSNEILPCQITNINDICREEFAKATERDRKGLEYQLLLPEEDIIIPTNAKYLALVIENLLSNAYKFTKEGKVTLGIQVDKVEKIVLIDVADTGCGVPPDKQEIIFERFTKLDSFTQGNGLGLFLSRQIINRLMGNIYLDSSYTKGACFVVSLPMDDPTIEKTNF